MHHKAIGGKRNLIAPLIRQVESFRKPLFISFCAVIILAIYFPFCGIQLDKMQKGFIKAGLVISGFQLSTIFFLAVALQYLPLSTSIIVRVSFKT